jgi:ketosteroid isomerase-like protein
LQQLEATVLDGYGHLNLSDADAFRDSLTRRHSVSLLAPVSRHSYFGRAGPSVPSPALGIGAEAEIVSKNLLVRVSPRGDVGWIYDEISYRVVRENRIASVPIRRTATYVWNDGEWRLVNDHRSYPIAISVLNEMAAAGHLPTPQSLSAEQTGPSERAAQVKAVLTTLHSARGLDREQLVSASAGSVWLVPGWDGEFTGARVREAPVLGDLFGTSASVRTRDCQIHVEASGDSAWATCILGVTGFLGGNVRQEMGLRATYVLMDRGSGEWSVNVAHVSAELSEAAMRRAVWGE